MQLSVFDCSVSRTVARRLISGKVEDGFIASQLLLSFNEMNRADST